MKILINRWENDIDGVLDEEAWQQALKLELKYEVVPGENIPAPVRTEVFPAHSKTAFYIGFRAHDPEPLNFPENIPVAGYLLWKGVFSL